MRDLDRDVLEALDAMVHATGRWLHVMGYLGAFCVDAILHEGAVYFAELNPRFQGSSFLAARLAAELGLPDIYLEHIGACSQHAHGCFSLGRPAPGR